MQFTIPGDVLGQLDIGAALTAELDYKPPYLPESPSTSVIGAHTAEMTNLLGGWFQQGYDVPPGEVLQVPKKRLGLRPVTVVDLPSRVLFRALVALLEPRLPTVDRSFEEKKRIERSPLEHPGTTYVVIADVAAFYDFVDHGLLEEELVGQTGEAAVAETLSHFLQAVTGRDFGLPQVLHPSDVLSEAFIDIVERRLLRLQQAVWRYNDDFYLAASSWSEVNTAVEALDTEIRRLGLTLNERKTLSPTRENYEAFLDRPEQLWNEINQNVQFDLREVGPYGDEDDEEAQVPDAEVLAVAAHLALESALQGVQGDDPLHVEVNRQLAVASISALRIAESATGIRFVKQFLGFAPQHSDRVARYLAGITAAHEQEISALYDELIGDGGVYISPWQALWMFEPLRQMQALPDGIRAWVGEYLSPAFPDVVRARAALTLAEKRATTEEELTELYGSVAHSSAPEVVLALAHAADEASPALRGVRRDSPVNGWIIDSVLAR